MPQHYCLKGGIKMAKIYDLFKGWVDTEVNEMIQPRNLDDRHGEEGMTFITSDAEEGLETFSSMFIDAVITDPPYGVNINPKWDGNLPGPYVWYNCCRCLKPGGHLIVFGQPSMAEEFFTIMREAKQMLKDNKEASINFRDIWIWAYQGTHTKGYKTEDGSFRSKIRNVFNPIYVFRKDLEGSEEENWSKWHTNLLNIDTVRQEYKGNHEGIIKRYEETGQKHLQSKKPSHTFKNMHRKGWIPSTKGAEPTNIQYCPRATKAERTINGQIENNHETIKPLGIMLWLVSLITNNEDQIILDPFMGTGSTGMACKILNRKFIGIDNDVDMVKLANFRIKHALELDFSLIKRKSI
jgi:DNA modification methylase